MVSKEEPLPPQVKRGVSECATGSKTQLSFHRLLGQTFIHFLKNHLPSSAAGISYFVMLAFFPLMLLLITLGNYVPGFSHIRGYVLETVILMIPKGAQETLIEYLQGVAHPAGGEIATCSIIILWAASWAFTIIEQAINRIWRTSCRSFLHGRLVSLLMMIGIGSLCILSSITTAALAFIHAQAHRISNNEVVTNTAIWQVVFGVVGLLLTISMFWLVYKVMPNTRVTIREALPGAALAGVLWELAKYLFAWFLAEVPYEGLYGSLATLVAVLTWIYISNLIMLFGAQMTALMQCNYLTQSHNTGEFRTPVPTVGIGSR